MDRLPQLLLGDKRICLAISEPFAGSDVANLKATVCFVCACVHVRKPCKCLFACLVRVVCMACMVRTL